MSSAAIFVWGLKVNVIFFFIFKVNRVRLDFLGSLDEKDLMDPREKGDLMVSRG